MIHVACGGGQQGCTGAVTLQGELFTFGVLNANQKKTRLGTLAASMVDDERTWVFVLVLNVGHLKLNL